MTRVRIEFTVGPFRAGRPGPHVKAALAALRRLGYDVEVGPFGNAVELDRAAAPRLLEALASGALDHGATGLSVQITELGDAPTHPLLVAVEPVVQALGGSMVAAHEVGTSDVPLRWEGQVVAGVRLQALRGTLARVVDQVEQELGGSLSELSREKKQEAARLLDERGTFELRNSVEAVADRMGVSRMTLYNYLGAVRRTEDEDG
ncbi:MAG: helix-turn-helix domain-containing protein [Acidimicrobiales bacterium]